MRSLRLAAALLLTLSAAAAGADDVDGFVRDAKSRPLPGAHVYVSAAFPKVGIPTICPSCYLDCGKRVGVDGNGSFRLEDLDPSLEFDLLAVADGYEPQYLRRVDPNLGPVRFELRPRAAADWDRTIIGFVEGPDGKRVVGALVEPSGYHIGRSRGYGAIPGLEQLSITNELGEFQLRMPEAEGKLDVRVTARGLAPYIERGLEPAVSRRVCLDHGVAITGRVKRNGKLVAGLPVVAIQTNRASSGYLGRFEIGTDHEGRFAITDLAPDETWAIGVPMDSLSNEVVDPIEVHTGGPGSSMEAPTLNVRGGRRVTGTISLPDGQRIVRGMRIIVSSDLSGNSKSVDVSEDRTFAFDSVPSGRMTLGARAAGLELSPASTRYSRLTRAIVLPDEGDVLDLCLVLVRSDN